MLHEFSRALALIVDQDKLHGTIITQLRSALSLDRVLLYLRDDDDGPYRLAAARMSDGQDIDGQGPHVSFARNGRLVRWLRVNEEPLLLDSEPGVVAFLDAPERAALEDLGITACVPLVAMNRLTGFLLVTPEQGHPRWPSHAQRDLLLAMAGQAALGCENAALTAEQRSRVRRMYQAERLATAGELAAGAAHEIRNPLTSIRSAIQYIRGDYQEGSDRHELAGDILAEVDRIDEIVQGLLSFARREAPGFEEVELAELVRQSTCLIRTRARTQGVDVVAATPDTLPVQADPGLLRQVLLNVMLNALQAMPDGGELRVSAERAGRQVRLQVADTGDGISREHLDRVFDPFFTTKKTGTGLGLSICYGIVERHGGRMELESEPGAGAVVTIRIPERQRP